MDEIEEALRRWAADEPSSGWSIYRNSFVTRVEAQTAHSYLSRCEAFAGAHELVEVLLALGYREKGLSEIGSIADQDNPSKAPERWRGKIALIMEPLLEEHL